MNASAQSPFFFHNPQECHANGEYFMVHFVIDTTAWGGYVPFFALRSLKHQKNVDGLASNCGQFYE